MAETGIKWLHSHGADNKDPDFDLGGEPSEFEIAEAEMNNLFDNVTSEEADFSMTDYRCFYIYNKYHSIPLIDIVLELVDSTCSVIAFGSKIQNDEQLITIQGEPATNGYMIIASEFGTPVTCYYPGTWAGFATEIEDKLQLATYCTTVGVSLDSSTVDTAVYRVVFNGQVKNRKVELIQLVQNNLVSFRGDEYRIDNFTGANPYNGVGDSQIKVIWPIATHPASGQLFVFNVSTGLYVELDYSSYSGQIFTLAAPLTFNLVAGDELWVVLPEPQEKSVVNITKDQDGSPINQFAYILQHDTDTPDWTNAGATFDVGILRPGEGFFVWVQRQNAAKGCTDSFSLILTGNTVP